MVAIFLKTNNNSSELNRVNHFLFSLTAARLQDVVVVLFYQISRRKNETNSMTVRGAELLRQELDFLKNERRPEIIKAIAEAREHGD